MQSLPHIYDPGLWDAETMAFSEKRFHTLESQVGQIAQRVANLEGHKEASSAPERSNAVLIAILSVLGAGFIAYWGWLGVEVVTQGRQISQILTILSPETIKRASLRPGDPQSAEQVKQIVQKAVKQGERIDSTVVSEAGAKFVDASKNAPEAWDAAIALINYKSFLDASLPGVPVTRETQWVPPTTYNIAVPYKGAARTEIAVMEAATGDQAARLDYIGVDQNAGKPIGNQYIVAEGGNALIDNVHMRNVIWVNVHIYYRGGPVIMENVYFLNCTFTVDLAPRGQEFAKAFLATSPAMSFKSSTNA